MKILVCYDGSDSAKEALVVGQKHAAAFKADVLVVFSLIGGTDTDAKDVEQANDVLAYAQKFYDDAGISCVTKMLVHGQSPGEDIVEYAEEQNVEEIVIGIKHRSKVGKLLFGSNAQYVILRAHCPVVAVK